MLAVRSTHFLFDTLSKLARNLVLQSVYAPAQKYYTDTHARRLRDRTDITANLKSYSIMATPKSIQ